MRRPWVVSHHSWYCRTDGRIAWQDRLKRWLLRFAAASIAVSRAVADDLATPSVVIPNPYRDDLFRLLPGCRAQDGGARLRGPARLGQGGGRAARRPGAAGRARVSGRGSRWSATARSGPAWKSRRRGWGSPGRSSFLGTRTGEELVEILNRHRILVVPSRYREPFGIVALEGIACGCVVVGSAGGGLKEAIGPCGETFRNGDAADLARVLGRLLRHPEMDEELPAARGAHLARHQAERAAAAYLAGARDAPRGGAAA